jgi:hypothetical protein
MAETTGAMTATEQRPKPVMSLINAIFFCGIAGYNLEIKAKSFWSGTQ